MIDKGKQRSGEDFLCCIGGVQRHLFGAAISSDERGSQHNRKAHFRKAEMANTPRVVPIVIDDHTPLP